MRSSRMEWLLLEERYLLDRWHAVHDRLLVPARLGEAYGTIDYLVPEGATRFTAVAGQPDDASNTTVVVRFRVTNTSSGEVLASQDLAYGQGAPIDVPLAGAIRVTLRIDVISYVISPKDQRGAAAWAEPTFC